MRRPEEISLDLESRVLSQLLLLQGTLHVFLDVERLAGFVERGLEVIPGIRRARLLATRNGGELEEGPGPAAAADRLSLPLATSLASYGRLELDLEEPGALAPYLPSVRNTANVIAVHLERQARERVLAQLNASLQQEIERKDAAESRLAAAQRQLERIVERPPRPATEVETGEAGPTAAAAGDDGSAGQEDRAAARLGAALMVPTAMSEISRVVLEHVKQLTGSAAGRVAVGKLRDGAMVESTSSEDTSRRHPELSFEEIVAGFPGFWPAVLEGRQGGFENRERPADAAPGADRVLAMPVRWGDRLVGYIAGVDPPRDYGADDLSAVRKLAAIYALAIRRQEGLEEERELARKVQRSQQLEALGTLASGIAHEFRNLLQIILGATELLLDRGDRPSSWHSELETIRTASSRGAGLTAQLLTFARRSEPVLETLDINRTIRQVATMLRRTLPRSVEIDVRAGEDAGCCLGDAAQIEQVLLNLALNASDAMPDGGRLTVTTRGRDSAEAVSEILVEDTGTGIEPRHLEHIFEPFFTTKGQGKGTGLGLAVAYGIVTGHGGQLECRSRPGRGTTFVISLPRVAREMKGATAPATEAAIEASRGETILVVDDEAAIRRLLHLGLSRRGYEVFEAASGEEAIELCRNAERPVDLVILDLGMAGMGGRACLEELLRLDPDCRVLVMTGYAAESDGDFEVAGARDVVSKPFQFDVLARKVRATLAADGSAPNRPADGSIA